MKWFARGGGIARSGPFDTQAEAVESMRLITETVEDYERVRLGRKDFRPRIVGEYPEDIFVWPEGPSELEVLALLLQEKAKESNWDPDFDQDPVDRAVETAQQKIYADLAQMVQQAMAGEVPKDWFGNTPPLEKRR